MDCQCEEMRAVLRKIIKAEYNPATAPYRLSREGYEMWQEAIALVGDSDLEEG
jgi:hypothetical protein